MRINGMPMNTKSWIVYRVIDGENWYWGSWENAEEAMAVAISADGEVCNEGQLGE